MKEEEEAMKAQEVCDKAIEVQTKNDKDRFRAAWKCFEVCEAFSETFHEGRFKHHFKLKDQHTIL